MNKFTFGHDFQRSLLRLCMTDEAFCNRVMEHIEAGYFTSRALGWSFRVMQKYYEEYGLRLTDIPFREAAKTAPLYASEVEAIIEIGAVVEADYIKTELREFIRRNIFAHSHEKSQKLYNDGKHVDAYDEMCEAMDQLRLVEFDAPDRTWFFDELDKRMKRRSAAAFDPTAGVYTTGVPPLDDIMDGGPKIGETHLLISPPKFGKTIWLINQGFVCTRVSRVPTLHINLEGSTRLVEDRYDSCFSTELYTNVRKGDITPSLYREMVAEYKQLRKLLVVRTLNDWDVNILHIEAELKELEAEGFVPEVIILDYVDLLRSRNNVGTETQHQIDSMKDTKRLSNRGFLIHTACQSQRPKEGDDERERIIKASNVADAYGKIRIADGYGSLNATRQERDKGTYRYYQENYRDGPVGRVIRLKNEYSRMRVAVTSELAGFPEKKKKKKAGGGTKARS